MSRSYKALLLSEQIADGRVSGTLRLEAGNLVFENSEIKKSMPVSSLMVEQGGTSGRHIYFKVNGYQYTFCSLDETILNEEGIQGNHRIETSLKEIKNNRRLVKIGFGVIITVIILPIISLLVFRNKIIQLAANQVPTSLEESLGSGYMKQLSITEKIDSNSKAVLMLREKASLLLSQVKSDQKFKIYISDSDVLNAFALPGGYVVFNKGLLTKADSWEEVLGVMGHEIAHVTQKHHARGVISKLGWSTVLAMVIGDGSALTNIIIGASSQLEQLSYSRDFENESDAKGFEYVVKAGINPQGMVDFFKKLEKESGMAGNIPAMLSTHPDSAERADNIQKKASELKSSEYKQLLDYQDFKKLLN